jgi:hypothetical protein
MTEQNREYEREREREHGYSIDLRLTRLEDMLSAGIREITRRLDAINGRVAEHERWREEHVAEHTRLAVREAEEAARHAERERLMGERAQTDRWRWGVIVAVGTALVNLVTQIALRVVAR